mgnify:CR=1 FL=1
MAKKAMVERNLKRQKTVDKYAAKRGWKSGGKHYLQLKELN